jgi:nicotinic acid phosphoribosyltransferase
MAGGPESTSLGGVIKTSKQRADHAIKLSKSQGAENCKDPESEGLARIHLEGSHEVENEREN